MKPVKNKTKPFPFLLFFSKNTTKKMGMSASTAVSQVQTSMVTNLSGVCTKNEVDNSAVNCGNQSYDHCPNVTVKCGNQYNSSLSCTMDQVAAAANKAMADASSQAQAAIGGSFSKSQTQTDGNVTTNIQSTCGGSDLVRQAVNASKLQCIWSGGSTFEFINTTDMPTQCYISAAASSIQTAAAEAKSTAKGWDPIGEFLDTLSAGMKALIIGAIVIVCVIVLAVVCMLVFARMAHKGNPPGSTPNPNPNLNPNPSRAYYQPRPQPQTYYQPQPRPQPQMYYQPR